MLGKLKNEKVDKSTHMMSFLFIFFLPSSLSQEKKNEKNKDKAITLVDQIVAQLRKEIILLQPPPYSNLPLETELMN